MSDTVSMTTSAAAVGASVISLTGSTSDGATAAGYSAFVYSITGAVPTVYRDPATGKVHLILTGEQIVTMQKWTNNQIFMKRQPSQSKLDIGASTVFGPLALKYLAIIGLGFFTVGYLTRGIVK